MIYIGLTLTCAIAYWLAGIDAFDALQHAFSTVSTGGFSTHDASFGYFNSPVVNFIAVIFMLLGAINFGVHFLVLKNRNPSLYVHDTEVRSFLKIVIAVVIFYTALLYYTKEYTSLFHAFDHALFQVTSVITSTGFTATDF